jgi:hypothetical protein
MREIDEQYYDHNYTVSLVDLASTKLCHEGYCQTEDEKVIKAMLYIFGLDIHRRYEKVDLGDGVSYHSEVTDLVQTGGYVYRGFERTDPAWLKAGKKRIYEWLYDDTSKIKQLLEGSK